MKSPSFYSQAGNFISATLGGVDPRTGLFNLSLPLVNLHSAKLAGPALALSLQYSPLSSDNEGFGRGFALNLTRYNLPARKLTLSTGEEYRVSSSGTVVKQKNSITLSLKIRGTPPAGSFTNPDLSRTWHNTIRCFFPLLLPPRWTEP